MDEYHNYNLKNKNILFQRIMDALWHKDYDGQIVAEWSSTWLGNHYGSLIKEKNGQYCKLTSLVFHTVEKPLWKYVPRVRAKENGSHYLNKYV